MNYLAHAYFSCNHPPIITGNLISDFIKGKKQYDFSPEIQLGIRLHRAIDTFTDAHPAVAEAKQVFRPAYRLYAGAFVDVAFDHFLACDTQHFKDPTALERFTQHVYRSINQHLDSIPENIRPYFASMEQQNWLLNYRHRWGIQKSFGGIVYRSRYLQESATAFTLFEQHYDLLGQHYATFIPELAAMVAAWHSV